MGILTWTKEPGGRILTATLGEHRVGQVLTGARKVRWRWEMTLSRWPKGVADSLEAAQDCVESAVIKWLEAGGLMTQAAAADLVMRFSRELGRVLALLPPSEETVAALRKHNVYLAPALEEIVLQLRKHPAVFDHREAVGGE